MRKAKARVVCAGIGGKLPRCLAILCPCPSVKSRMLVVLGVVSMKLLADYL